MSSSRRHSPLKDVSEELAHCSTGRRFELLSQTSFFSHLTGDGLDEVNRFFREVHYQAGDWIYHPGDPADRMFVVAAGQVKLLQHGPDGKDVVFQLAAEGDLIGAQAAIRTSTYTDGAQAHSDCCLLQIARDDFQALLERQHGITMKVLEFAGAQLEQAREVISGLSTGSAEQRIARTLLRLAERHGEQGTDGLLIQLSLPQQDLAAMTGTTIETVSRTLSQLRQQGLIKSGRRWISLTDVAALREQLPA